MLSALVAGILAGMAVSALGTTVHDALLRIAGVVGGLWLNALKMTVIPLIVALLITGIVKGAEAARAGRIAGTAVAWFVVVCTASAVAGALLVTVLLDLFPLNAASASALQAGIAALDPGTLAAAKVPGVADFIGAVVPPNVIAAASNGDVLQLVIFALLFALALTRVGQPQRGTVTQFFTGVGDALLVIIGWVLWLAPLGVFALAFTVGAGAGSAAFAGLLHYIVILSSIGVIVMLIAYLIAVFGARVGLLAFARAMIAPQSVAISTQSSLASLPAMLGATRVLGVTERGAEVVLPLAIALFRATGPAMNVAVAFYVADWLGLHPSTAQMIAATAVAAIASYGAVSLPGQISFVSSIGPIALALGAPIAPLALLVAVETIPDIFRTLGNVTMDVAVTAAVDYRTRGAKAD